MATPVRPWLLPDPTDFALARAASRAHGIGDTLVAGILLRRGYTPDELADFLRPDLTRLHEPGALPRLDAAVRVLDEAIRSGRRITIYGDYDVDGTTATALLVSYLRAKGAVVDYFIPMRAEGYGLSRASLERIIAEQRPELIVTVDCGTSSRAEVEFARGKGVEVIVTDHHQPTPGRETVGIVVNPHLAASDYPNRYLAGVGVAYKLVAAHHGSHPSANLDLVALGTVADVMPLASYTDEDGQRHEAGENRILVAAGLDRLAHTHRPGLVALLATVAKPVPCEHGARWCTACGRGNPCVHAGVAHCFSVSAERIGYGIGPRINAIGRMGLDPMLVVELLITDDPARAREIAGLLDETNRERRSLTDQLLNTAIAAVAERDDEPVIVLQMDLVAGKGVAGLVAGRLVSTFDRPAIVIDLNGEGSARSVPGLPLLDVLQGELSHLVSAAGHQGAMGISAVADAEALRAALCARRWPPRLAERELRIDAVCSLGEITPALLDALDRLEPTGEANRAPLFAFGGLRVLSTSLMSEGRHVRLRLRDATGEMSAVWFGGGPSAPAVGDVIDVAAHPRRDRDPRDGYWRIELGVEAVRPAAGQLPRSLPAAA